MRTLILFTLSFSLLFLGCERDQQADPTPTTVETPEPAAAPVVEVAADGTVFNPPIDPATLPDGVWYCEMGTTHYARTENGDARCPECGMALTLKGDKPKSGPETAHDDHEGHDHH